MAYELYTHASSVHELPASELLGSEPSRPEFHGQGTQADELHAPYREVGELQVHVHPTTNLLRATKLKHSSDQAEFQRRTARLQATIEHQDRELAKLQQAKETAHLGAEELKRELAMARQESATHRKDLSKAEVRISKLLAKVKALESASVYSMRS